MDNEVKEVYERIASEFNLTRRNRVWPCVMRFLDNMIINSNGVEIGCGNGKNMLYRNDINMCGVDFCNNFIDICRGKNLDVYNSDMRSLPFDNNKFDFSISIAVLHHLYNIEDRVKAINEQIRITKDGGLMFILVWDIYQSIESRRKFSKSDEMVSWKMKTGETLYRYYHLYSDGELRAEIEMCNNIKILECIRENNNIGIIFRKEVRK